MTSVDKVIVLSLWGNKKTTVLNFAELSKAKGTLNGISISISLYHKPPKLSTVVLYFSTLHSFSHLKL